METTAVVIAGVEIFQDVYGRYSLNTLHKASGSKHGKEPSKWLENQSTQELIAELQSQNTPGCIDVVKGGNAPGTYAHELLAVSYAGWISPVFQLKVNQVFLDSHRGTALPQMQIPAPFSLERLREYRTALEELGLFDDRDRLMFADAVRTQYQRETGMAPLLPAPQGFDMEDALRLLAPHLTSSQIRKHTPAVGKLVAAEYRRQYGKQPGQTTRFIDGKARGVNWYQAEMHDWIDPMLQSYLASQHLLTS